MQDAYDAHPAAQSYASIRGTRSRRGTIVRKTITATKEKSQKAIQATQIQRDFSDFKNIKSST